MKSNNKLNEVSIKNRTRYYFNVVIKFKILILIMF